jgi:aquaporin Z
VFILKNLCYTNPIFHCKGGKYMATKKAASSTKKATVKKSPVKKQPTTKVTTVKAVEARPVTSAAAASSRTTLLGRINRAPIVAALIAEFIGTFLLAATVIAGQGQPILILFALVGIVLTISALSGAYVNPALTIAGWVSRRLTGLRALGYVVAQILGAMLALVLLNSFVQTTGSDSSSMLGQASLFKAAAIPAGKEWLVLSAELIGSLIFGFAFAAASRMALDRAAKGLTIGLGYYIGLMIAGSLAAVLGASAVLNPAVAVALQAINFSGVWPLAIYGLASVIGAVLGFLLHDFLTTSEEEA